MSSLTGKDAPISATVYDPPADISEEPSRSGTDTVRKVSSLAMVARQNDSVPSVPTLGGWNVYFLGKLAFYWYSIIGLHPLENLAFALVLLLPIKTRWLAHLRTVVAVPVAIVLLYYDTWLPPFERFVAQASQLLAFSLPYLIEIAGRFINGHAVLILVVVAAAYIFMSKYLRVGVAVLAILFTLTVLDGLPQHQATLLAAMPSNVASSAMATGANATLNAASDLDTLFDNHLRSEASRQVHFPQSLTDEKPFDLLFLHICSLSWDDLQAMGLEQHPLLARFDILLTRFNAAATYSGPAAIRLLRAPCGQSNHSTLYAPVSEQCYLIPEFRQAGFETDLILNHDGYFDDMLGTIRKQGAQSIEPMSLTGLPISQHSFDGSPIYEDLAVLNRWADTLQSRSPTRIAAIYNTISLHDGNQLATSSGSHSSKDTYKVRLKKLLDDLEQFIVRMEQSHRRMVVILIPEHGAAIRGDRMQISGMREIPMPAITLVPVGVKIIGPDAHRNGAPLQIATPTTYLALAYIVSHLLEHSPFQPSGFRAQDYVADLPETPFVAENADMVMMQRGDRYYLRMPNAGWSEYLTAPMNLVRDTP